MPLLIKTEHKENQRKTFCHAPASFLDKQMHNFCIVTCAWEDTYEVRVTGQSCAAFAWSAWLPG